MSILGLPTEIFQEICLFCDSQEHAALWKVKQIRDAYFAVLTPNVRFKYSLELTYQPWYKDYVCHISHDGIWKQRIPKLFRVPETCVPGADGSIRLTIPKKPVFTPPSPIKYPKRFKTVILTNRENVGYPQGMEYNKSHSLYSMFLEPRYLKFIKIGE